jgi:hypothetical protein
MPNTMPNIIAAQFDDFPHAENALQMLSQSGCFASTDIDHVVLGAPGRHDRFPVGGDEDADAGAVKGDRSARKGAAIGGAAGAVTGIPLGPVGVIAGAALGAYGGSLAGALGGMGQADSANAPPPRPAGIMVMVHASNGAQRDAALQTFRTHGARSIEEADGQWGRGTWTDFNPVSKPRWLVPPSS